MVGEFQSVERFLTDRVTKLLAKLSQAAFRVVDFQANSMPASPYATFFNRSIFEDRAMTYSRFIRFSAKLAALTTISLSIGAQAADIKIGLVAALTGQSAQSGEAITRGLTIAIDEINAKGGVLGEKLVLIKRDDESSPPKGVTAARELISNEKVVALSLIHI